MSEDETAVSRRFLVILFLVALGLLVLVISPFAGAFFAAAVLAGIMQGPQVGLTAKLGNRPGLAAGILTFFLVLVVIIPIAVMGIMVVDEGSRAVRWTVDTAHADGVDGLVQPLPEPLRAPVSQGLDFIAKEWVAGLRKAGSLDPQASSSSMSVDLASVGKKAAGLAQSILGGLGQFMMQLVILVIATFFLLAQGPTLVNYIVALVPLESSKTRKLLDSLRRTSVAVFSSTVVTAAIQTLVATLGYVIVGLPSLSLLVTTTFICSFIPAVGAASVSVVAGIFLLLAGSTGQGIFLLAFGLLVVGMIDNLVKPWLTQGGTELPGSLIFFAMICGLAVLGPMGLVGGPLIVVFFQVVARMLREECQTESKSPTS